MSWISGAFFAASAIGGAYAGLSALMARGLTSTARIPTDETPAAVGLQYESVAFAARGDETTLHGWLCPPPGCADMRDAQAQRWVVLAHGYGSNRSDPSTGILGLTRDLHERNFGIFLFDFRASGSSGGERGSAGYFEQDDLLGALDYLHLRGVERERIGVLGQSMGGAVALLACSNGGSAAAVVADSAFADLWMMIGRAQEGLMKPLALANPGMSLMARLLYGVDIGGVSPARSLAASETPVLIIHGEDDTIVPLSHARLLGRAADSDFRKMGDATGRVWIVPGAGHVEAYRKYRDEYVERVSEFLGTHLLPAVRSGFRG